MIAPLVGTRVNLFGPDHRPREYVVVHVFRLIGKGGERALVAGILPDGEIGPIADQCIYQAAGGSCHWDAGRIVAPHVRRAATIGAYSPQVRRRPRSHPPEQVPL